jgi:hypothetical protein
MYQGTILPGQGIADDPFHLDIARRYVLCAGLFERFGMTIADMSCRERQ